MVVADDLVDGVNSKERVEVLLNASRHGVTSSLTEDNHLMLNDFVETAKILIRKTRISEGKNKKVYLAVVEKMVWARKILELDTNEMLLT